LAKFQTVEVAERNERAVTINWLNGLIGLGNIGLISRFAPGWTSYAAAFGRPDCGYPIRDIQRWMEALWPNARFAETNTTRHLSSGLRTARSTHLTASNAPFTNSLRDVSTVAARSSGTAKKSTAAYSVVRTVHDMRQLETALQRSPRQKSPCLTTRADAGVGPHIRLAGSVKPSRVVRDGYSLIGMCLRPLSWNPTSAV
jgi:hypothetical protein